MSKLFVEWDPIYSVGIKGIDKQHQKIFNLINHLEEVAENDKVEVQKAITELKDYALYHFDTEENLFNMTNYAEKDIQKREHDEFKSKLVSFSKNIDSVVVDDLFDFLVEWLINHILKEDMKYSAFIKKEISNKKYDLPKDLEI